MSVAVSPALHVEQVLVVPTVLLHELGYFQGFSPDVNRYLPTLLDPLHTSYRPRNEMESDPNYKQLIPYCVFQHVPRGGEPLLFQYTRGRGQGEGRLHAKRSIGVGGHIASHDGAAGAQAAYEEGMRRELHEEIAIGCMHRQHCLGLINDDLTEVGKVHLGIVHLFDLELPRVLPREPDLADAGFVSVRELWQDVDRLESWSRLCLEALFPRN